MLVIEDNPINQTVARGMLEKLGCQVDMASNGVEGVGMAGDAPYDLILMDCQMPVMDGYEASSALRIAKVDTPIVAMTAAVLEDDRSRCLEAGMNDHLAKPVRPTDLAAMLERWVDPREPAGDG